MASLKIIVAISMDIGISNFMAIVRIHSIVIDYNHHSISCGNGCNCHYIYVLNWNNNG